MPPPRIIKSHLSNNFFITISLVETFAPEIMIVIGFEFSLISLLIVATSLLMLCPAWVSR